MTSFRGNLLRVLMKMRPNPQDVPFERQREIIGNLMRRFTGPKQNTYQETRIQDIPALWITPPQPAQQVMLYLHGGGYTIGSQHTERMIAGHIALLSRAKILVPHYRLAPEAPFPAALDDVLACYQHLLDSGIAPENIIVGGLSAGGGLTVALMLKLRDLGQPLPRAGVLLSAWLDLTGTAPSITENTPHDSGVSWNVLIPSVKAYIGSEDVHHPLISPVFADLHGLPPMLVQVGDIEILLDDSRQFAQRAQAAGSPVELRVWRGMIHGWHIYRFVPEARQATQEIADFITRQTVQNHTV